MMMTNQDYSEGDEVRSVLQAWTLKESVRSLLTMANKANYLMLRMTVSGTDPSINGWWGVQ